MTQVLPFNQLVAHCHRWVVKVGSGLITADGKGIDLNLVRAWVAQICALKSMGKEVVLVSSGAVAEGMQRLGMSKRPETLHELQAAAAVGQMGLVQTYATEFKQLQVQTAQILLTHHDLAHRTSYINARSTLRTLLDLQVVPIINENDTVATEEIRFGDNDTLAASVANLIEADLLVILTDQEGMYESDPHQNKDAKLIRESSATNPELVRMATSGGVGKMGRGGMVTKVKAAEKAARSGAATLISYGRTPQILTRLAKGEHLGTLLRPVREPLAARKQWFAGHLTVKGYLSIDRGAVRVLRETGSSLLPVGVTEVRGQFHRGDLVVCLDDSGQEIARGLVNYSAMEAEQIRGQASHKINEILGYQDEAEMIHRDNLALS